MKKINKGKKLLLLLILSIVCLTSCENANVNSDTIETASEEDFISSSEENTSTFEKESENVEIVLHMNFDSTVSEEEALAQFEKATKEYVAKDKQMSKSAANKFRYQIITKTGNAKDDGTDDIVHSRVWFNTDNGPRKYIKRLDNPNENDFKKGAFDYFLLEVTPSTPVCELTVKSKGTAIGLKGTDGWGLDYFRVMLLRDDQITEATGGNSIIQSYPLVFLYNMSSNQWAKYTIETDMPAWTMLFSCN